MTSCDQFLYPLVVARQPCRLGGVAVKQLSCSVQYSLVVRHSHYYCLCSGQEEYTSWSRKSSDSK
jgi:hypothetical protein